MKKVKGAQSRPLERMKQSPWTKKNPFWAPRRTKRDWRSLKEVWFEGLLMGQRGLSS